MTNTTFNHFRRTNSLTLAIGIFGMMLVGSTSTAGVLADYDDNWVVNSGEQRLENISTGIWNTLASGHATQSISIDNSVGVSGSAAKIDVTAYGDDGLFKIYFAYDEDRYTTLDAPDNNNRMVLYTTIPNAGQGNEHTFHIGTYSKDPNISTSTIGNHWYHYYKLRGSSNNYWTKMYMDKHPQHVVGSKETVKNNPTTGFDYFDGLTRLYLQMRYSPFESNWPGPYTMYVDEIEFYSETRVENDYSINGVAITYFGDGEFDIDWSSFSPYSIHNETYEVRYSFSPIDTISDYTQASLVPGSPSTGWGQENIGHHDNHYRANFKFDDMIESRKIYFAIRDLYPDHPKDLKRVDYIVLDSTQLRPLPPSNLLIKISN